MMTNELNATDARGTENSLQAALFRRLHLFGEINGKTSAVAAVER
ncbi:MAG: hypothetical protein BWY83_00135 [bacterium ADurb.Bin478]|nr:MAG: hypothetical protein BWY83_00135 [bacterium ADurb.Bin478]